MRSRKGGSLAHLSGLTVNISSRRRNRKHRGHHAEDVTCSSFYTVLGRQRNIWCYFPLLGYLRTDALLRHNHPFLTLRQGSRPKRRAFEGSAPGMRRFVIAPGSIDFGRPSFFDILVDAFLFPCRRRAIQVIVFSPCALIEGKSLWHPGWFFYIIPPEGKSGFSNSRGALTQPL